MKTQLTLLLCLIGGMALAQTTADERAIRQLVNQQNNGQVPHATYSIINWPGPYNRPHIGKKQYDDFVNVAKQLALSQPTSHTSRRIERLTIAKSADVAYEYGTISRTSGDAGESSTSAYLRTWRKENGQWLMDAVFQRPFGGVTAESETK